MVPSSGCSAEVQEWGYNRVFPSSSTFLIKQVVDGEYTLGHDPIRGRNLLHLLKYDNNMQSSFNVYNYILLDVKATE